MIYICHNKIPLYWISHSHQGKVDHNPSRSSHFNVVCQVLAELKEWLFIFFLIKIDYDWCIAFDDGEIVFMSDIESLMSVLFHRWENIEKVWQYLMIAYTFEINMRLHRLAKNSIPILLLLFPPKLNLCPQIGNNLPLKWPIFRLYISLNLDIISQ